MRIEILLFIVAGIIMANIYYEGKLLKKLLLWKKYYQMAGVFLAFLVLYYLIKKNPLTAQNILATSNEYIKYLPIDKNTKENFISPILDFSSKTNWTGSSGNYIGGGNYPIIEVQRLQQQQQTTIASDKKTNFKRSVSETKKKYISAQQGWKCYHCKQQLSAFYEVDHIIPLYGGGSNDLNNLVSLCRECHAKKTAMDRMKYENKNTHTQI
jgi:hypothetical protein